MLVFRASPSLIVLKPLHLSRCNIHTPLKCRHPNKEVRSTSAACWVCCLFINRRIHWLSILSFSMSCYTPTEPQLRCHPSFLMGTGDCGAALLPWQQALSHSPHIARSVPVAPPPPHPTQTGAAEPVCPQTGQSHSYLPPALTPDAPPTTHTLLSSLLIHDIFHWLLSYLTFTPTLSFLKKYFFNPVHTLHRELGGRTSNDPLCNFEMILPISSGFFLIWIKFGFNLVIW